MRGGGRRAGGRLATVYGGGVWAADRQGRGGASLACGYQTVRGGAAPACGSLWFALMPGWPLHRPCRVALALLKEAPEEFLRRITIICLEDALLHPGLPLLVWATAAQVKLRCCTRACRCWCGPRPPR